MPKHLNMYVYLTWDASPPSFLVEVKLNGDLGIPYSGVTIASWLGESLWNSTRTITLTGYMG